MIEGGREKKVVKLFITLKWDTPFICGHYISFVDQILNRELSCVDMVYMCLCTRMDDCMRNEC